MKNNITISIITSLYRSSKYLDSYFLNILEITNLDCVELVIVHNDPTIEEKVIIDKYANRIPNFTYLIVARESIYTSWNKAVKLSRGKYLAMWSVDDRRTVYSLEQQSIVLDKNPDCMVVSGDYIKVFDYGDTIGFFKKDPVKKSLTNKVPKFNNGCFLMWRKSVHESIGYFDEQFKVAGDWEFWARVTYSFKALRTDVLLGYYLRKNNEGISKKKGDKTCVENQIIMLRYYNIYAINIYKLLKNNNIHLSEIVNFGIRNKLYIKKTYIFNCLPSIILFWIPYTKKVFVKILFLFREYKAVYEKRNLRYNETQ